MIYLFTAMYYEAFPLIQYYHLKKEISQTHFQIFTNESIIIPYTTAPKERVKLGYPEGIPSATAPKERVILGYPEGIFLVITGTGMIAAASAVSAVFTAYPPTDQDFLVNIGICAGLSKRKECFLCNKITEQTTGKTFYPDLIYRYPFSEAELITVAAPVRKDDLKEAQNMCLYDMEASAVYQAGSYFLGPHQMIFLKMISDGGDFEKVTPKRAENFISAHMDTIADFLSQLKEVQKTATAISVETDEFQKETDRLCQDLHCSHVMAASVRQQIRYCILAGIDYRSVLDEMYRERKLPCRDKREGKLRLEELFDRLL